MHSLINDTILFIGRTVVLIYMCMQDEEKGCETTINMETTLDIGVPFEEILLYGK